jgi:hypothetical protein
LIEVNSGKPPSGRRRNKKKKRIENRKDGRKKKNIFYMFIPPVWLHFQTAADNCGTDFKSTRV